MKKKTTKEDENGKKVERRKKGEAKKKRTKIKKGVKGQEKNIEQWKRMEKEGQEQSGA